MKLPIVMFSKIVLASLVIGITSVNAFTVPVTRSPAPEPESVSPLLFSTIPFHDPTSVSFNSLAAVEQGPRTPKHALGQAGRGRHELSHRRTPLGVRW